MYVLTWAKLDFEKVICQAFIPPPSYQVQPDFLSEFAMTESCPDLFQLEEEEGWKLVMVGHGSE